MKKSRQVEKLLAKLCVLYYFIANKREITDSKDSDEFMKINKEFWDTKKKIMKLIDKKEKI